MQPVLEFVKRHSCSYTYSIRASQMGSVQPLACYVDRGHVSLAACLFDAAEALGIDFPRVHVRYQGFCMGEIEGRQLARCAELIAQEWMLMDDRRHAANLHSGKVAALRLIRTG